MKRPFPKKLVVLPVVVIVLGAAWWSHGRARAAADLLVGVEAARTVTWFQPIYHGKPSPRWCFTYWAVGETGGMIAEVHVSPTGQIRYRKGFRVSGSSITGIDS